MTTKNSKKRVARQPSKHPIYNIVPPLFLCILAVIAYFLLSQNAMTLLLDKQRERKRVISLQPDIPSNPISLSAKGAKTTEGDLLELKDVNVPPSHQKGGKENPGLESLSALPNLQSKISGSILIWAVSPQCQGVFLTPERTFDPSSHPTLILHDVAVDNRHAFRTIYDAEHVDDTEKMPYRRLNAVISAVPGVKPIMPFKSKVLQVINDSKHSFAFFSGRSLNNGWRVEMNHVHEDVATRTWLISLSIFGPASLQSEQDFQNEIDNMLQKPKKNSIFVEMHLPVVWQNETVNAGKITQTRLSFSLCCVFGMSSTDSGGNQMLPKLMPKLPPLEECEGASGSVLVAGSALHGFKRDNELGRREVANFVARAINGPIRFTTVAIPILIDFSAANIESICGFIDDCTQSYHSKNVALLQSISNDVEHELKALQVPESEWSRVALFPVCTLGNDFDGVEKGKTPCITMTVANGFAAQVMVQDFSYTLFSPFHKWFAFLDIDEFLVDERKYLASRSDKSTAQIATHESAFSLFNRRTEKYTQNDLYVRKKFPVNSLMAGWLDFSIFNDQRRNITRELSKHGGLEFVSTVAYHKSSGKNITSTNREKCSFNYGWYGKNIVSCDKGIVGIRYHMVTRFRNPLDIESRYSQEGFMDPELKIYHARAKPASGPRFGDCLWIPERS